MGDEGEWRVLRQSDVADGTLAALQGLPASTEPEGGLGAAFGSRAGSLTDQESPFQTGASSGNAIIGVMSSAEGAALRRYGERERYEEWLFLAGESGL